MLCPIVKTLVFNDAFKPFVKLKVLSVVKVGLYEPIGVVLELIVKACIDDDNTDELNAIVTALVVAFQPNVIPVPDSKSKAVDTEFANLSTPATFIALQVLESVDQVGIPETIFKTYPFVPAANVFTWVVPTPPTTSWLSVRDTEEYTAPSIFVWTTVQSELTAPVPVLSTKAITKSPISQATPLIVPASITL